MIRRIQLTLLMLFVGVWAMASETSVKNADGVEIWYDFDSSAKTASVTYKGSYFDSYVEYIGNVVIPSKVMYEDEEYSVTKIGDYAFCGCYYLTSITIPESVTEIGSYAFGDCCRLYEVYNKSNLTITAGSWDNGEVAYYAKNVYTDSEGSSKLKIMGDYIFYVDGDNIELLAYTGDEKSIILPSDYEGKEYKIANYAFYNCCGLTSVTIPEGVTSIGSSAFSGTAIYNNESNWENNVLYIDNCLIDVKTELSGEYAIKEDTRLIASYAFEECSGLTSITIPEGVTKIGEWAFDDCSSLTSITSKNTTPPTVEGNWTFFDVDKSIPLYVPAESVEAYKSAEYWKDFTNIQGIDDTPITDVVADSVSIRLIGNSLIVEGAESYAVYALSGQCLGKVESLERGVYIVVADGVSKKIVVK